MLPCTYDDVAIGRLFVFVFFLNLFELTCRNRICSLDIDYKSSTGCGQLDAQAQYNHESPIGAFPMPNFLRWLFLIKFANIHHEQIALANLDSVNGPKHTADVVTAACPPRKFICEPNCNRRSQFIDTFGDSSPYIFALANSGFCQSTVLSFCPINPINRFSTYEKNALKILLCLSILVNQCGLLYSLLNFSVYVGHTGTLELRGGVSL